MSNIVKSLSLVSGLEGTLDVVALDDGVNAYIVNCKATMDIQFNDPAASFASRCIASLLLEPEPVNPIELAEGGRIENIRIHFPLHHSLTRAC
ncbi:hypothetical protein [Vibrio sp. 10N.237.312.B06]|uniref:hypothetical protein n=1 Tax=Vibrio sp. 10N.237.312.B06 TaxID=3229974 RepID=UPI003553E1A0